MAGKLRVVVPGRHSRLATDGQDAVLLVHLKQLRVLLYFSWALLDGAAEGAFDVVWSRMCSPIFQSHQDRGNHTVADVLSHTLADKAEDRFAADASRAGTLDAELDPLGAEGGEPWVICR